MGKAWLQCEDEPIHLCGQIQGFGYLVVFDYALQCIAISDNFGDWLNLSAGDLLGSPLNDFWTISKLDPATLSTFFSKFEEDPLYRQVSEIKINDRDFHWSIYQLEHKIYFEFEQINTRKSSNTKLYSHARHLDAAGDELWFALCSSISTVINFDRVMLYKFMDDGSGQVIAEKTAPDMTSLLGYKYPESDIPKQARELYTHFIARHTVDVDAPTYSLLSKETDPLDLSKSSIRALSPTHLQYLRHAQVRASASFSVLMDGQLWGLVTCQHRNPKMVDLAQRHLCVFLAQYAVNRHLAHQREIDLQYNKKIKSLELELKEKLLVNRKILEVLAASAPSLCNMVSAQGLAIQHPDGVYLYGESPILQHFREIQFAINQRSQKELLAYHNFTLVDQAYEETFPGVAKVVILREPKFSLYWFRKEIEIEETWAGNPKKTPVDKPRGKLQYPSPRTSFEAWKRKVKGHATPWKKRELLFMRRMRYIVQDAVMKRVSEIQELNERLVEVNNTLDTYSYTLSHDLKNPLSSIKLAAQVIQQRDNLPQEFLKKVSTNILEAVDLMTNMMQRVFEFSKAKTFDFEYDTIHPEPFIYKIIAESKERYYCPDLDVQIGQLHPIVGEKTLLYQLFLNVLANAVKYSSKTEYPQVCINSHFTKDDVIYRITDNGIGIPADEVENIFEIFKRMSNSSGFEGSGIGLSIVKRIADRLHAEIKIESELGQGSTFIIKFKNHLVKESTLLSQNMSF
ncbi:ATP-binding protein [Sphingobacterium luzhongxinii]|uniref:ATP-binding protein n=1 Tax=Sphingobacterium luzhongxinii TaxID=2654181 RepID=UPI0013DC45AD|nr:ATP-binding protein [Sphingobacterium sp. xlx-73]